MSHDADTKSEALTQSRSVDSGEVAAGWRVMAMWPGGSAAVALAHAGARILIGRGRTCELRLDDASVSRQHVVVHAAPVDPRGERQLEVEDLGSANGTRINGQPMVSSSRVRLAPGDVVEIGAGAVVVQRPAPELARPAHAMSPPASSPPRTARSASPRGPTAHAIVLESEAMKRLYRTIDLLAQSRINVLIIGETGVGKEVAAQALHDRSPRASRAFVPINCASMPENLLEAELFGYEKGAFTGAERSKPGLLEAADGGTLLLDEVGEMPLMTQAKLLRVLEQREVWRIGSLAARAIDVRVVAATNRSLEEMADRGTFRRDLFYRLNGLTLHVPPLREHPEDIEPLAARFLAAAAQEAGVAPPPLSPSAQARLRKSPWVGNVRELKNAIERALILSQYQTIEEHHLGLDASIPPADRTQRAEPAVGEGGIAARLDDVERDAIVRALEQTGGNQTKAAELLGMSRRTLVKRIGEYGLPRPRKK